MPHWDDTWAVDGDDLLLSVHVQPGAGRTAVVGRHGRALKLRVAAPPVDDRANRAVADLLAEVAGVGRDAVTQVSGATSRMKRFRLSGVDPEVLDHAIDAAIERGAGGAPKRRGA
jgi:uncharacterized protein (TIGR00251 family)